MGFDIGNSGHVKLLTGYLIPLAVALVSVILSAVLGAVIISSARTIIY